MISLQSHSEVLNTLDSGPTLDLRGLLIDGNIDNLGIGIRAGPEIGERKVFVSSVSPQVRASLAATYNVSQREAGWMIDHLLGGPQGLASGGKYGNSFAWIVDTNAMREMNLVLGADEVMEPLEALDAPGFACGQGSATSKAKKPILTSACPGWVCYAEKTHPHVLPHLSRLKSPQALTGTLIKSILSIRLGISPHQIWHLAVMPCFDKKLEASREEFTDVYWRPPSMDTLPAVRDVDCVITPRELLMLADSRGISFRDLPRKPLPAACHIPFPDAVLSPFLFPHHHRHSPTWCNIKPHIQSLSAGTSGGYLYHILSTQQSLHPHSTLSTARGRNADVIEYTLVANNGTPLFKAARYYGFRNIQNLVRKLKPARAPRLPGAAKTGVASNRAALDYAYVEVMACPGGCTNGGGQIKAEDAGAGPGGAGIDQKEWQRRVDEAYFSMDEDTDEDTDEGRGAPDGSPDPPPENGQGLINGIDPTHIRAMLQHWSSTTGVPASTLVRTGYRAVESDVGKGKAKGKAAGQAERVVELAGKIGGGW